MSKTTPYIDAEYYINTYKASKNARITGTFNNVEQHKLDFDAFRNRASEITDRLLSGKVSALGGVDAMSDTFAKELIRKSTAAFVEHWFIKGFTMADLNSSLNIGSLNAQNIVSVKTFREIAPLSALANLQKTGMWESKAVGVKLSKELQNAGIDPSEVVTWADALAIFEAKDEGLNFHIEGDMSGELTGMDGKTRFIKILETTQEKSSFEIIGGTDEFTKTNIEFKRNGDVVETAEALIYSLTAAPDAAGWWFKIEDGKTIIYMEVKDDQDETRFAISNAYPDRDGLYGVLGSTDNSAGLTEMNKVSIIDGISNISLKTISEYPDIPTFDAEPLGSIGYIKNADDTHDILLKSADGVKTFKDYESITAGLSAVLEVIRDDVRIAQETADNAKIAADAADAKAELNKQSITDANQLIAQKQDEVDLDVSGGKVIKRAGTFSSKDSNGNRQPAADPDDLIDKELLEEVTDPIKARVTTLENSDKENLKRADTKTPTNSSNKVITEEQFDELEKNLGDRTQALEDAEQLTDKVWEGSKPFSNAGAADLTGIVGGDGTPFTFEDGKALQVFIKHTGTNLGKDGVPAVNSGTGIVYVIPNGAQSDTLAVTLADTGIVTGTITNGNDDIDEFEVYKVVEANGGKNVLPGYTKNESDAKYATKAQGQLAADMGGVKVSGDRDLSDVPSNNNKENVLATEEYTDALVTKAAILAALGLTEKVIPIGERTIWVDHDKIAAVDAAVWEPAGITEGYGIGQGSSSGEELGKTKTDKLTLRVSSGKDAYSNNPVSGGLAGQASGIGFLTPANGGGARDEQDDKLLSPGSKSGKYITESGTDNKFNEFAHRKGTFYKNKVELVEFIKKI